MTLQGVIMDDALERQYTGAGRKHADLWSQLVCDCGKQAVTGRSAIRACVQQEKAASSVRVLCLTSLARLTQQCCLLIADAT